jgi:hypothetical protein
MAELNSFSDNVIAMEVIKESDLLSRSTARQRDPLQPLVSQGPMNGVLKQETPIKHKYSWLHGCENRISSSHLRSPVDSNKKGTLAHPVGLDQTIRTQETLPVGVQEFIAECAFRDFIHERLGELHHRGLGIDSTIGKLTSLPRC